MVPHQTDARRKGKERKKDRREIKGEGKVWRLFVQVSIT